MTTWLLDLPACMEKDRITEFNVKFCISVFLLHAGRPTSISLKFSFIIDNEIEACMCMCLWLSYSLCLGLAYSTMHMAAFWNCSMYLLLHCYLHLTLLESSRFWPFLYTVHGNHLDNADRLDRRPSSFTPTGACSIGHGGTRPHFHKWLDMGCIVSRRTANKKLTKLLTDHHERAHKND